MNATRRLSANRAHSYARNGTGAKKRYVLLPICRERRDSPLMYRRLIQICRYNSSLETKLDTMEDRVSVQVEVAEKMSGPGRSRARERARIVRT